MADNERIGKVLWKFGWIREQDDGVAEIGEVPRDQWIAGNGGWNGAAKRDDNGATRGDG